MNYVPLLDDGSFKKWLISLDAVHHGDVALRVGEKQIPMKDKGNGAYDPFVSPNNLALVDTGAPSLFMPEDIVNTFHKAIPDAGQDEKGAWYVPCNATNLNLTFTIGGIDYPLYWGDLVYAVEETNTVCKTLIVPRAEGVST